MLKLKQVCSTFLVALLIVSSPLAWGTTPLRYNFAAGGVFPLDCDGYGFGLEWATEVEIRGTLFVDADENPVVWQSQNTGIVQIYRDDGIGDMLEGKRREMQKVDFSTGENIVNGGMEKFVVPGYGPLFFEVGRIVFDSDENILFAAGQHDDFLNNTAALCAYFGQF
jgi:hypothetical protein